MAAQNRTDWHLKGEGTMICNCDWGCPCQFDALPTHGSCEGMSAWIIEEGHFGDVRLDGVKFSQVVWWPGPMHEGQGYLQLIVDESATAEQRAAMTELYSSDHGGGVFEIFAAVCPNRPDPIYAPITLEIDRETRHAHLEIPGVAENNIAPIKTRVTGEEHRAQIALPGGWEFKIAEMANNLGSRAKLDAPLKFEHANSYAQLNEIDWTGTETL
jgi:hypothetical protein